MRPGLENCSVRRLRLACLGFGIPKPQGAISFSGQGKLDDCSLSTFRKNTDMIMAANPTLREECVSACHDDHHRGCFIDPGPQRNVRIDFCEIRYDRRVAYFFSTSGLIDND